MQNDDNELPEDEEEILVYVEFDGSVASNALSNEKLQLDMIGLDMEHPIMQVNGKFYEGTYHNAVGTYLFFEDDKNPCVDDPVFDTIPSVKYFAKTRKVLKMNRILVELKTDMLGDSNDAKCLPNMEVIKRSGIPPRYQEGALKTWEGMRHERMKALNDYLDKQRIRDEKRLQGIEPDSASDDDHPFAIYKAQTKRSSENRSKDESNVSAETNSNAAPDRENENKGSRGSAGAPLASDADIFTVMDSCTLASTLGKPSNESVIVKLAENLCNSDSNEDTLDADFPNAKGVHKAQVQVTKPTKTRRYVKTDKKKTKKMTQSSVPSTAAQILDSSTHRSEISSKIDEIERDKQAEEKMDIEEDDEKGVNEEPTGTLESMESLSISPAIEETTNSTNDISDWRGKLTKETTLDKRKLKKQQRREEKMRYLANQLRKAADERRQKDPSREDVV